jgi:hypothetical protein
LIVVALRGADLSISLKATVAMLSVPFIVIRFRLNGWVPFDTSAFDNIIREITASILAIEKCVGRDPFHRPHVFVRAREETASTANKAVTVFWLHGGHMIINLTSPCPTGNSKYTCNREGAAGSIICETML